MIVKRYDVWLTDLNPVQGSEIAKKRPCVIISPNVMNALMRTVIVVPLTSSVRQYPFRIPVNFLGKPGYAAPDHIRSVDKSRLIQKLGSLPANEILGLQEKLFELFQ